MSRGVTAGRPPLDDTLLVDIGGGSTELVLGSNGEAQWRRPASTSAAFGSPSGSSPRTRRRSPSWRRPRRLRPLAPPALEATSGDRRRRHRDDARHARSRPRRVRPRTHARPRIQRTSVERKLERMAAMTLEERMRVPGIEPGRAPVIVAGLVVLREIVERVRARRDRGLRARHPARRGVRGRGATRARGRCGAARRLHLLLRRYAAGGSGSSSSSSSSSSARRRWSTLRESTPTRRSCSSTTGTRSASSSSRNRKASSSGTSGPIVWWGASAIVAERRDARIAAPRPRPRGRASCA